LPYFKHDSHELIHFFENNYTLTITYENGIIVQFNIVTGEILNAKKFPFKATAFVAKYYGTASGEVNGYKYSNSPVVFLKLIKENFILACFRDGSMIIIDKTLGRIHTILSGNDCREITAIEQTGETNEELTTLSNDGYLRTYSLSDIK